MRLPKLIYHDQQIKLSACATSSVPDHIQINKLSLRSHPCHLEKGSEILNVVVVVAVTHYIICTALRL
jgi:hypothetical protein